MSDTPLVWYIGNRNPSITDVITVGGAVQNLTGLTVTFSMRLLGSAASAAPKVDHAVATFVTDGTDGAVKYDWAAGDVDTEGFWVIWWEVLKGGKLQDKQETIIEIRAHGTTGLALVELLEVKMAMETRASDTKNDDDIRRLIPVASRKIIDVRQREFAPASAPGVVRRIDVRGYHVDLAPYDLRAATQVVFDPDATAIVLQPHIDYELLPVGGDKDGVYTEIKLSQWLSLASTKMLAFGHADLAVTGSWGYAAVPGPVKEAAIIAIRAWLKRDLATYAAIDGDPRSAQPAMYATYKLPKASLDMSADFDRYPPGMAV